MRNHTMPRLLLTCTTLRLSHLTPRLLRYALALSLGSQYLFVVQIFSPAHIPFLSSRSLETVIHILLSLYLVAVQNFAVSASQLRTACEACVSQEVYTKHLSPSLVDRAVMILDEEQRKSSKAFDGPLTSHVLRDACARLVKEQQLSPSLIRRADATLRNVACGY
jgi:hypothetical protein